MVAAEKPTVAFVIASTAVSGTERRISRIFTLLSRSDPGRYHLIISEDVFRRIRAAKFGLEDLPNVHILKGRSILDRKIGAEEGWITNIGRSFTVRGYRSQVQRIVRDNNITILQVYLELMRFIGIFPMKNVKMIASLVSHLPKYYDGKSIHSRLLYRALRNYDKVDALYEYITQAVSELGVSKNKLNSPRATCVDHDRFKPEAKEPLVTFAGRTIMWKNPWLMLQVIRRVAARVPDAKFYMMGEGGLTGQLIQETEELGLASRVPLAIVIALKRC